MLVDAIERAKRDVSTIKDMEWNLWNTGKEFLKNLDVYLLLKSQTNRTSNDVSLISVRSQIVVIGRKLRAFLQDLSTGKLICE
jgi:hypothetical protein